LSVRFFQNFKLENLRESANNRFFTALKNAIFEKNTTDINEKKTAENRELIFFKDTKKADCVNI
jgi:hypothetical protein